MAKLNWAQYWEWRTTIEEMNHAKTKYEKASVEYGSRQKDAEIVRLGCALFKPKVDFEKANFDAAKSEYDRFKKKLEETLGQSLDGCVIDEVTLEVKKLETENKESKG